MILNPSNVKKNPSKSRNEVHDFFLGRRGGCSKNQYVYGKVKNDINIRATPGASSTVGEIRKEAEGTVRGECVLMVDKYRQTSRFQEARVSYLLVVSLPFAHLLPATTTTIHTFLEQTTAIVSISIYLR